MTDPISEAAKRRTFAIISHPDAGKTTLTEKFLLYGGVLTAGAGAVKAKGARRSATSDWMELEQQRGISITSTVLQFPYRDKVLNLLDTPGHRDFSEDTYRVLSATDAAIMVLDGSKGIEAQTRKLFEVCRERDIPIVTFINKWDRPARDPLELLDEIEDQLVLEPVPISWPVGDGDRFPGGRRSTQLRVHPIHPHRGRIDDRSRGDRRRSPSRGRGGRHLAGGPREHRAARHHRARVRQQAVRGR